jgi:hypothetical protein
MFSLGVEIRVILKSGDIQEEEVKRKTRLVWSSVFRLT